MKKNTTVLSLDVSAFWAHRLLLDWIWFLIIHFNFPFNPWRKAFSVYRGQVCKTIIWIIEDFKLKVFGGIQGSKMPLGSEFGIVERVYFLLTVTFIFKYIDI